MAKFQNILNNILRRIRIKTFPGRSIPSVAEMVDVPAGYLTKIENGDMDVPNVEMFERLLVWYAQEDESWAGLLREIQRGVQEKEVAADTAWPQVTALVNDLVNDGEAIQIFGTGGSMGDPKAIYTGNVKVNRVCFSVEGIIQRIADRQNDAYVFRDIILSNEKTVGVAEVKYLDPLLLDHARVAYFGDVFLALRSRKEWAITANADLIKKWYDNYRNLAHHHLMKGEAAIDLINSRLAAVRSQLPSALPPRPA